MQEIIQKHNNTCIIILYLQDFVIYILYIHELYNKKIIFTTFFCLFATLYFYVCDYQLLLIRFGCAFHS